MASLSDVPFRFVREADSGARSLQQRLLYRTLLCVGDKIFDLVADLAAFNQAGEFLGRNADVACYRIPRPDRLETEIVTTVGPQSSDRSR